MISLALIVPNPSHIFEILFIIILNSTKIEGMKEACNTPIWVI
jgi:hypothetical protein